MKRSMKSKLASMFLALVLIAGLMPNAFAATNPYPKWQTYNGATTIACTYYAWQEAYDRLGVALPGWNNAKTWLASAQGAGYRTGSAAMPNSIAVWTDSGAGHVAYVTAVNGDQMTINEGGRSGAKETDGIITGATTGSTIGSARYSGCSLIGFIYLSSAPEPVSKPSAPSEFSAIWANSGWQAQLSWSGVDGATGYDVQYKRSGIDWRNDGDYGSGTSYTSTGLKDWPSYDYRVRARNGGGASDWAYITIYKTVTIHFNANGGTVSPTSKSVTYNSEPGIPANYGDLPTPTRAGYEFIGWTERENGGTAHQADWLVLTTNDETLYAQWKTAAHSHSLTHTASKAATCETDGNIEYWYCAGCGKYFSDSAATREIGQSQTVSAKLGHNLTHTSAKAASETTEGNIEYWRCSRCGKYFADSAAMRKISLNSTVLPKLTHQHTLTHTAAKAATEQAEGNVEYWYCSGCGKYFSDGAATKEIWFSNTVLPKLNHQHTLTAIPAKAATCTENGNLAFWHCESCGKYFSNASASNETDLAAITLERLGHAYANGVCTRCGTKDPNYIERSTERDDPHPAKQTIYFQGQFTDVPANQWFTKNVSEAFEMGLMKGDSASTFNPYGDVTLAEAITMAARIHSIYTTGAETFVQSGKWYQVYLDYAYNNGIISRAYYNADVTRKATRAQFAEIFANALPDKALYPINSIPNGAIPDVPLNDNYAPYTYKLYRAGILTGGDANGTFSPQTYITRAEAAAIVSRMAEANNRVSFSL